MEVNCRGSGNWGTCLDTSTGFFWLYNQTKYPTSLDTRSRAPVEFGPHVS